MSKGKKIVDKPKEGKTAATAGTSGSFWEKGLNTRFSHTFNSPEFQKPFFRNWLIFAGILVLAAAAGTGVFRDTVLGNLKSGMAEIIQNRASTMSSATEEEVGNLASHYQISTSYAGTQMELLATYVTDAAACVISAETGEIAYYPDSVVWISGKNIMNTDETFVATCMELMYEKNYSLNLADYYVKEGIFYPGVLQGDYYETEASGETVLKSMEDMDMTPDASLLADTEHVESNALIFAAGEDRNSEIVQFLETVSCTQYEDGTDSVAIPKSSYLTASMRFTIDGSPYYMVGAMKYDFWTAYRSGLLIVAAITFFVSLMGATVYTYIRVTKQPKEPAESDKS